MNVASTIVPEALRVPQKPRLVGMDRAALAEAAVAVGEQRAKGKMRANQLFHWLYFRGARSFDDMTTISKEMRAKLAEVYDVGREDIARAQVSADGTRKWLVRLADGALVETVYIPDEDRATLCVSPQVGCTLTCRFCHTGTQPWVRNLSAAEIVGQVMLARDELGEWPSLPDDRMITNIVLMGMGEPLYNYDNVVAALGLMMDNEGIAISRRRITVSTAGVVPMIGKLGDDTGAALAISLHATRDEVRDVIVPLNKKYPIAELMDSCRRYPGSANSRRITFEYVMLKGVNDSERDARELVQLIAGIPAKVNLIPFNPWPGSPYECSDEETIARFAAIVNRAGYSSPVRTPRGRDILAACGQLKSDSLRQRKSARSTALATSQN
ncbi:MAG: 23S rRNA (adenine(2503)-C(2))-methyltransferase RlmN [Alphaproteobacteria bacterium]|nr:23S rRNA (adenine(2503)-C(2))-methyltransferase RlmN [Alphaproteobacteria bacterium]